MSWLTALRQRLGLLAQKDLALAAERVRTQDEVLERIETVASALETAAADCRAATAELRGLAGELRRELRAQDQRLARLEGLVGHA